MIDEYIGLIIIIVFSTLIIITLNDVLNENIHVFDNRNYGTLNETYHGKPIAGWVCLYLYLNTTEIKNGDEIIDISDVINRFNISKSKIDENDIMIICSIHGKKVVGYMHR